jgi:hypothetical protein
VSLGVFLKGDELEYSQKAGAAVIFNGILKDSLKIL